MSRQHTAIRPDGYTYLELRSLLNATMDSGLSALMRGHPGVGKSTLAAELATNRNLELIDIRLAQRDPAELAGVYFPITKKIASLYAPDWVKRACERPRLVFLDEINAGSIASSGGIKSYWSTRRTVCFHPDTLVLRWNLTTTMPLPQLSSALCNRFVHFALRVDADCWLAWQ